MNLFVPSQLPRNTLHPLALRHKFLSADLGGLGQGIVHPPYDDRYGLAGLGDQVCYTDETGADQCYDNGISSTTSTGSSGAGTPTNLWAVWGIDPAADVQEGGTYYPPKAPYLDSNGDLILSSSSGGYTAISPSGSHTTYPSGSRPSPSTGTISPSQAAVYAQLITSLTNAGVRIAAITSLPAGATLLPNGTILGAGQTIGPAGTVNPSLASVLSNPLLIVGGLAAILLIASSR